jgi:hypothetical protein
MFSSTFNFRSIAVPVMAIGFALMMTIAYHLLIVSLNVAPGVIDTTFKSNILAVENYEFNTAPVEKIALGSSILNTVVTNCKSLDCENLCIRGYSSIDGIEIIRHTQKYPRLAVVELSFALTSRKPYDYCAEVPDYKRFFVQYTPIVRTSYQPSSILLRKLQSIFNHSTKSSINTAGNTKYATSATKLNTASSIDTNKAHVNTVTTSSAIGSAEDGLQPIPPTKMNKAKTNNFLLSLQILRVGIKDLEKHGTFVCFVRVPLSEEFESSQREVEQRKLCEDVFPQSKYPWIEWHYPPRKWQTWDGIHLKTEEAELFGEEMQRQLQLISEEHNLDPK